MGFRFGKYWEYFGACLCSTCLKTGIIQRLAWPLSKDDTNTCTALHSFYDKKRSRLTDTEKKLGVTSGAGGEMWQGRRLRSTATVYKIIWYIYSLYNIVRLETIKLLEESIGKTLSGPNTRGVTESEIIWLSPLVIRILCSKKEWLDKESKVLKTLCFIETFLLPRG